MKALFLSVALGAGVLLSAGVYADTAPAGAIAQCKDGTYFTGTSHSGACKGHHGVKEWLDKDKSAAPAAAAKSSSAAPAKSETATKTKAAKSKKSGSGASTATDASTSKKSKSTKKTDTAAAAPAAAATPIAKCKDGTTFNGTSHKGACRGHKGVAEWLDSGAAAATPAPKAAPAATAAPKASAPAATAPAAAPAPAPKPSAPAATAPAAAAPAATPAPARTPPTPASQITQKAGGGPGLVWVNSESKVYHCQGDEWYGKTKEGSYMSEAAAKSAGNRAARGKECTP